MAKEKAAVKKAKPARSSARRKAEPPALVEQRAARDVPGGASTRRIERSLDEGTKQTLQVFRGTINWR